MRSVLYASGPRLGEFKGDPSGKSVPVNPKVPSPPMGVSIRVIEPKPIFVQLATLFVRTLSNVSEVTVAVFWSTEVTVEAKSPYIAIVWLVPLAMLAKVVDPVQSDSVDPSIANFASVTWLGRLSDSNTFDAVFGPLLVTTIV